MSAPTCPPAAFYRVYVDYLTLGGSTINWEMNPHWLSPLPWTFQLQVGEADVNDPTNWNNVGAPVVNTFTTMDPDQRYFGKEPNVFYRVMVTDGNGDIFYSGPQDIMGRLDFWNWGIARELIRKELLRLQLLKVGIDGYFMKALRSGQLCPQCVDQFTQEGDDSTCPVSYGQRWTGGYYTAVPMVFGDINPIDRWNQRTLDGPGMTNPQDVQGIFVGTQILTPLGGNFMSARDVWVNKHTDQRYEVHPVKVLTHIRGVPLITSVDLRFIPTDDVRYQYPLPS